MKTIKNDIFVVDYKPFHPVLEQWMSARGESGLPPFSRAKENDAPLEGYRMVAKIGQNPLSVFYMEAGSVLEELYGDQLAKKNLDELYTDWFRKMAYRGYQKAIDERAPVYERRKISTIIKQIGYRKLHLPYGDDAVTHMVTYIIPLDERWKKKEQWENIVKLTPWLNG